MMAIAKKEVSAKVEARVKPGRRVIVDGEVLPEGTIIKVWPEDLKVSYNHLEPVNKSVLKES